MNNCPLCYWFLPHSAFLQPCSLCLTPSYSPFPNPSQLLELSMARFPSSPLLGVRGSAGMIRVNRTLSVTRGLRGAPQGGTWAPTSSRACLEQRSWWKIRRRSREWKKMKNEKVIIMDIFVLLAFSRLWYLLCFLYLWLQIDNLCSYLFSREFPYFMYGSIARLALSALYTSPGTWGVC